MSRPFEFVRFDAPLTAKDRDRDRGANVARTIWHALLTGAPIPVERFGALAAAAGVEPNWLADAVAPHSEFDHDGAIIGFGGLSLYSRRA